MDFKADVEKAITEFGAYLEPIISRLEYDKYIEGKKLCDICVELSNLDLLLENLCDEIKPTVVVIHVNEALYPSLYSESIRKIKEYEGELDEMNFITKGEKKRIKSCCEVLTETSITYFRSRALFPDF